MKMSLFSVDELGSSPDERILNHPHVVGVEFQATILLELFCNKMMQSTKPTWYIILHFPPQQICSQFGMSLVHREVFLVIVFT